MQTIAGKLDWLKERKDFLKDPVARIATRLLQYRYMPHGEDLYPWILREVKRGNIQLPTEWQEGSAYRKLIEMEMGAEREIARRQALADSNDPEAAKELGEMEEPWHDDSKPIDWDNLQTAPWNKLSDTLDAFSKPRDHQYDDVWDAIMAAHGREGGSQFKFPAVVTPQGERGNWFPIEPQLLKEWTKVLEDRAKRRKGVDPMQMSAPDFYQQMYKEWLPEYEDRIRNDLGQVVHKFPDKWTIRRLQNEDEAAQEGEDMGHCVGGYGTEVKEGNTHIFSLRDPRNRPHATFEINPISGFSALHRQLETLPLDVFARFGVAPADSGIRRVIRYIEEMDHYGDDFDDSGVELSQAGRNALAMAKAFRAGEFHDLINNPTGGPPWSRGRLQQVQGKENSEPIPEYQERIRDFFGAMPPEYRPVNLEETSYYLARGLPAQDDVAWNEEMDRQQRPAEPFAIDPDDPGGWDPEGRYGRTEEHYPSPAHKSIVTGEICHCPWGPDRDLWSWNEPVGHKHSGQPQRDVGPDREDAVREQVQRNASIAQVGVGGINTPEDRLVKVPREATDGSFDSLRSEDMPFPEWESADASGADSRRSPSMVVFNRSSRLSPAEGSVPTEVTDRPLGFKEHHEPIHSRRSIADWEPEEIPEFHPWSRGHEGKGLITSDGNLIAWDINDYGEPHHDAVSAEEGVPYVAKVNIYPDGTSFIPSPDELHLFGVSREDAEAMLAREAPRQGLRFSDHFESSTQTCPVCGDPLKGEFGTFCPRCQWSEQNANLDHDPLSNPPDPTVDMHRGIQASNEMYHHTIPTHRWSKWYDAAYDMP